MGGLGPGVGGFELVVIGLVALLVVGPKDLPILMRRVGQMVAKARAMANEFRTSFDEMARQSELDDLRKEVEALRTGQGMYPLGAEADAAFKDINAGLTAPSPAAAPAKAVVTAQEPVMTPAPDEWPDLQPAAAPAADEAVAPKPARAKAPAKAKPKANLEAAKPASKAKAVTPKPAKVKPASSPVRSKATRKKAAES